VIRYWLGSLAAMSVAKSIVDYCNSAGMMHWNGTKPGNEWSDGIDVRLGSRHFHHLDSGDPSVAAAVVTAAALAIAAASTAVVDNSQQSRLWIVEIVAVVDFADPIQVHSVVSRCYGYFDDLMLYTPRHWR